MYGPMVMTLFHLLSFRLATAVVAMTPYLEARVMMEVVSQVTSPDPNPLSRCPPSCRTVIPYI